MKISNNVTNFCHNLTQCLEISFGVMLYLHCGANWAQTIESNLSPQ